MMKIECPECAKSFIWTDDMSLTGKCPGEDCNWHYNVQELFKKNVSQKILSPEAILCPNCRGPITSGWTVCRNCGNLIIASRSFEKKQLFILVALLLIILSLIFRYWS